MENQNNNKGVIILLIVIIVILLTLCVLFATGTISFNSNKVNDNDINENVTDNNQTNQEENNIANSYNFGDEVILTQLSNINYSSIGFPDESGDFSKWKVLKDEGEYVTLYYTGDELLYGKADKDDTISKYNERKILFTSNGINFGNNGEIRILNESDLLLFGCNLETLICTNMPEWIDGWTSHTKDNYKYTLSDGKLNPIEKDMAVLAFADPVIKILKSNIK